MSVAGEGPAPSAAPGREVMGLWPTLFFSFVTIGVFVVLQVVVFVGFMALRFATDPNFDPERFMAEAVHDGLVLSVATLVTATLCTGLVLLFVKYGSRSTIKAYLGLETVGWKTALIWFGVTALAIVLSDGLTYLLDRPVTPDFLVRTYETAEILPLFLLALVLFGPMFEEVLFRGFMFAGIRRSRLGVPGAVVITALLWAAIHLQYDLYGIATIFALGIVLGAARARSGSLVLTFALHAAINLVAVTQVALLN
jgi:membrane protease YdiL (CAAX protease family)